MKVAFAVVLLLFACARSQLIQPLDAFGDYANDWEEIPATSGALVRANLFYYLFF